MQTVIFNTAGDGYWSNVAKAVRIVDMQINYCSDEKDFGELQVYFDTATWDVDADGLIYTDKQFMRDLHSFLAQHNLSTDVDYSEQGMQDYNFVSCDIGADFIKAWEAKFNTVLA
jgi:hypothetical protein